MRTDERSNGPLFSKELFPFIITGITLVLVGIFLISQSVIGKLLPHDIQSLGMTSAQLSVFNEGKILKFMFHDRVAFGGSLISIGIFYAWLAAKPLRNNERWAWWLFLISGISGFGSFLTYIGYGYLDLWHLFGTLCLLPVYLFGLYFSYKRIMAQKSMTESTTVIKINTDLRTANGFGNCLLLLTAAGLFLGGVVIMLVGMTMVFVPQDLDFMQIKTCGLTEINPRLISIIAHDRASFGGGIATTGLVFFFILWRSQIDALLWKVIAVAITCGFLAAIGVHFWIRYLDFWHLAPAYFGAIIFYTGLLLIKPVKAP